MTERSAEERERARQERERRRQDSVQGQQAAAPPPPPPPEDDWLSDDFEPAPAAPRGQERTSVRRPPPSRSNGRRPGASRRRSWPGRVLAVVAILAVLIVLWFLLELFQPFAGSGHGEVTVTIPPHAGTSQIADILDRDGVISCTFPDCRLLFELRAKLDGRTLLSGTYRLKKDMSFESAISALSKPGPAAKVKEVTIIPGETRAHISALLHSQGVAGSYLAATRHSRLLKPTSYGAKASTPDLEGFLFPDTYQLRVPISINALVADQLGDFKRRFAAVNLAHARSRHLTPYDVLIVASLVQAEAQTAHDFPLVASTIYNRLRLDMPLGLDSTTRYATGNYNRPLTVSQLHSSSPWNTHTHKGLPPTPIDSPALSAIQAAAHPASTNYLYFVSKPCKSGALAFSSGYSAFLVNVQHLQAAHGHYSKSC
jgi:UPF0755 protein